MGVQYYCPEAGQLVGATNSGPVFNTHFDKWEQFIKDGLLGEIFPNYDKPDGKRFLNECKDHEQKFAREINRMFLSAQAKLLICFKETSLYGGSEKVESLRSIIKSAGKIRIAEIIYIFQNWLS